MPPTNKILRIAIIAVSIIIAVAVFAVAYWLVSPFWRTVRVDEPMPVPASQAPSLPSESSLPAQSSLPSEPAISKTGTFSGFDRIHNGSGTAQLIQVGGATYVRFESDFAVTNGPDLYVGFGKNGEYVKGSELAALKGNQGAQNYEVPADMDISGYDEVWIWCKAFSVPFARAVLR